MNTNMDSNKSTNEHIVLPELSYTIMGMLFSVHNELGPSLLEKYYQRAVTRELDRQAIPYKKEFPVCLMYKDEPIGKYILDFIINDAIILETKAQIAWSPKFFRQTLAYLKETGLPLAIIVNFRRPRVEYKRIINSSYKHSSNIRL